MVTSCGVPDVVCGEFKAEGLHCPAGSGRLLIRLKPTRLLAPGQLDCLKANKKHFVKELLALKPAYDILSP